MIRVCSFCLADSALRCPPAVARRAGFSWVVGRVVVAGIGLLMALIAGMLAALRASAQAATCASNLRQLAAANLAYAADHGRFVTAAADIGNPNTMRWHGERVGAAFDGSRGPLASYLGGTAGSAWVRRCPAFTPEADGFEASCGGYGYNLHGVGSELCVPGAEDGKGCARWPRPPAHTYVRGRLVYGRGRKRLIEYSFVSLLGSGGGASTPFFFLKRPTWLVRWTCAAEPVARTGGPVSPHILGWFGPDDNSLFDPF